jgi:hypothetical protein
LIEVGEQQLGVDDLDVPHRIHRAGDVVDVFVLETAHDLDDGVHLADVRQELVAETFALAGTPHESRDVDELDHRLAPPPRSWRCRATARAARRARRPCRGWESMVQNG